MTYVNKTYISNRKAIDKPFHDLRFTGKSYFLHGHWNIDSAINYARTHDMKGQLKIKHLVLDTSGQNRGGHDGRYLVNNRNRVTKLSAWSEYGLEH